MARATVLDRFRPVWVSGRGEMDLAHGHFFGCDTGGGVTIQVRVRASYEVLLQLFAANGTRYTPPHDETATSGSAAAESILQGSAIQR